MPSARSRASKRKYLLFTLNPAYQQCFGTTTRSQSKTNTPAKGIITTSPALSGFLSPCFIHIMVAHPAVAQDFRQDLRHQLARSSPAAEIDRSGSPSFNMGLRLLLPHGLLISAGQKTFCSTRPCEPNVNGLGSEVDFGRITSQVSNHTFHRSYMM